MGGQLIGLNQNGWPFSSAASEHSALTGAALSELGLSLLLGSVNFCQGLSLMEAHTYKNMYAHSQIRRHSLARSGCCCPSGLCSVPAVTSSLCLCCRWCASSLGYLSFCWLGTSPLVLLPGKWERERLTTPMKMEANSTCPAVKILVIIRKWMQYSHAMWRCSHAHLPLTYSQQNQMQHQALSGKW